MWNKWRVLEGRFCCISTAQIFKQYFRLELGGNIITDSENPFVLLARITAKERMVNDYLEIAEAADKAVEKTEEGMLFHNVDRDLG